MIKHAGARRLHELDRRRADAAAAAVNERRPAGGQRAHLEQIQERGEEDLRERRRLLRARAARARAAPSPRARRPAPRSHRPRAAPSRDRPASSPRHRRPPRRRCRRTRARESATRRAAADTCPGAAAGRRDSPRSRRRAVAARRRPVSGSGASPMRNTVSSPGRSIKTAFMAAEPTGWADGGPPRVSEFGLIAPLGGLVVIALFYMRRIVGRRRGDRVGRRLAGALRRGHAGRACRTRR